MAMSESNWKKAMQDNLDRKYTKHFLAVNSYNQKIIQQIFENNVPQDVMLICSYMIAAIVKAKGEVAVPAFLEALDRALALYPALFDHATKNEPGFAEQVASRNPDTIHLIFDGVVEEQPVFSLTEEEQEFIRSQAEQRNSPPNKKVILN